MIYRIVDKEHARVGEWVARRANCQYVDQLSTCIGLEKGGNLIAGVVFDQYRVCSICMHMACEEQFTRNFIWFCFYYPFEQLGVSKVIGIVDADNDKAISIDRRLGFREEARITDATPTGDLIILSMTKDRCKWLNAVRRQGENHGWRQGRQRS